MKLPKAKFFDLIIIGAGAAGLFCASQAAKRGKSVLLIEHQKRPGSKILISGGGRCNFSNLGVKPECYLSENEHFVKSALARFTTQDFLNLVNEYEIEYYEKKLGQLFCKHSAKDILKMLESECEKYGVKIELGVKICRINNERNNYFILVDPSTQPEAGAASSGCPTLDMVSLSNHTRVYSSTSLVIATGGLSFPKLGATDFGYQIAKQFNLKIVTPKPALDGFIIADEALRDLSGMSLEVILSVNKMSFRENILFTHKGLSGPAALQGSLYWNNGDEVEINLLPNISLSEVLMKERKNKNKQKLQNYLSHYFPDRFLNYFLFSGAEALKNLSHKAVYLLSESEINLLHSVFHFWKLIPKSTVGYEKAEVTKGGVSTDELSSKSMECKKYPGLYFIGEVVDVTGQLGGYNFQWAWASAYAAANHLCRAPS